MKKILVSACLLGNNVKYNGNNNYNSLVISLSKDYELIPFCPEMDGGLSCPRNPSEIRGNKVFSNQNVDVSDNFYKGASIALDLAKKNNPEFIVLKEGSPSCGVNLIYDGTFTNNKIKGQGITTRLLKENGYKVISEEDLKNK